MYAINNVFVCWCICVLSESCRLMPAYVVRYKTDALFFNIAVVWSRNASVNSENSNSIDLWVISCIESDELVNSVIHKGMMKTISDYCVVWNDLNLLQYLQSNPTQVLVCNSCRKRFTDFRGTRVVDNFGEQECGKKLRSSVDTVFAWKAVCVLCCETIDDEEQHHKVQTLELQQTLLKHFRLRGEDAWSVEANGRLNACNDLIAEEACYHAYCFNHFTRQKKLMTVGIVGRPENVLLSGLFDSLCQWLESCAYEQVAYSEKLRMWMVNESSTYHAHPEKRMMLFTALSIWKRSLRSDMVIMSTLLKSW